MVTFEYYFYLLQKSRKPFRRKNIICKIQCFEKNDCSTRIIIAKRKFSRKMIAVADFNYFFKKNQLKMIVLKDFFV